jgi:SAM-dependent methyltransferase
VNGDTVLQSSVLEDLSDAMNYRRWLADLARPHLGDQPLEIGSGTGCYALEWLPDVNHLTATEADDQRLASLATRFAHESAITVRRLMLPTNATGEHSAVVALNVLEHIDDQVAALRSLHGLLRPGGAVVLVVPAFAVAMSRFDRAIGHVRRYTVASLRTALEEADLEVEEIRYINPAGLIAWIAVCRLLGRFPANGPMLRWYDRFAVPLLRRAERRWRPPFGQSVFAVARVPS